MKWIKLMTDIFDNAKIRLLSAQTDGDTLVNLWIRMLCVAGKDGRGTLMLGDSKPYDAAMLAILFGKRETVVARALERFRELGMIDIRDGVITLPGWEEYQNVEAIERAQTKNCERQRRYRERRRAAEARQDVTRNACVTVGNASDKDKETDKETDKDVVEGTVETTATSTDADAFIASKNGTIPNEAQDAINDVASAIGLSKSARLELCAFMDRGISPALVRRALELSQDNGAGKWSYMRVILKRCADRGIFDVDALNEREERFHAAPSASTPRDQSSAPSHGYQEHRYTESDFGVDFYCDPNALYRQTS